MVRGGGSEGEFLEGKTSIVDVIIIYFFLTCTCMCLFSLHAAGIIARRIIFCRCSQNHIFSWHLGILTVNT